MTKEEALKHLKNASRSGEPSRINRSMTRKQAVEIVQAGIESYAEGTTLNDLMEKRVMQVCLNRVRVGKLDTRYLHISDVDRMIGPHGEAAQDAVDRDMAMEDDEF